MNRMILEWERFYKDMFEWVPAEFGGRVLSVNARDGSINANGETYFQALANINSPQRAGDIAGREGLVDKSGRCPVDAVTC